MDGDTTERLSQESQCPEDGFNGLLARASAFAGGVLSSIQALAGTTACKGVQIARLKEWALNNGIWIDDISPSLDSILRWKANTSLMGISTPIDPSPLIILRKHLEISMRIRIFAAKLVLYND